MAVRNVQILWGSKTSNNGSKMAVFETKIQTKKQYSSKAVEQKDLYFHGLYQKNLKKTRNFDYFILLFWKNKLKFDAKESIYSFFVLKR